MAEPILGEALALQSNRAPDTSKVITAGTGKMLDIGLKKEIAKQKAEEERAKRNQQIMSSIKVDVPKVNLHLLPEAQKLFTNATSELTQAAMKGDTFGKAQIEGKYNMLFNNLALQSQAIDKFLSSETQGFIVPQEVKVAFSMPKEEGQAYLKDLLNKKPEYRTLVDVNEYGDYAFNSVKNRNLSDDFNTIIGKNERLFEATGKKTRNNVTRDEMELYKIPASRIEEFSTQLAVDPEFRANVILKDRATYDKIMSDAAKANPNLRPEEVEQVALRKYAFDRLENINQKTVKSNIPQPKGDFNFNFGKSLSYTPEGIPKTEPINIRVKTAKGEEKRPVYGGNFYGFKPVEILNTQTNGVIDIETNSPVNLGKGNTFDLIKVGEAVSMPVAIADFTTSKGVKYKKGQVIDEPAMRGLTSSNLVQYSPMIKGQVTYKDPSNIYAKTTTKSVLIPVGNIADAVITSASTGDQNATARSIQEATREAQEMTTQLVKRPKIRTNTPTPKVNTPKKGGGINLSQFDKTK